MAESQARPPLADQRGAKSNTTAGFSASTTAPSGAETWQGGAPRRKHSKLKLPPQLQQLMRQLVFECKVHSTLHGLSMHGLLRAFAVWQAAASPSSTAMATRLEPAHPPAQPSAAGLLRSPEMVVADALERERRSREQDVFPARETCAAEAGDDRDALLNRLSAAEASACASAEALRAERQRAELLEGALRGAREELGRARAAPAEALHQSMQARVSGAQRFLARRAVEAAHRMLLSQCFRALCLNVSSARLVTDRRRFRELIQASSTEAARQSARYRPPVDPYDMFDSSASEWATGKPPAREVVAQGMGAGAG
eukprot:scaffold16219_cov102-Isochrysis_galbana.AAC.5